MRLFADECVYRVTTETIRGWGYNVITAQEENLAGEDDEVLLQQAIRQGRVLITNDLDFCNIRHYPPSDHCGIIVLKIRPYILNKVHTVLNRFLESTAQQTVDQTLVIVDRNKYRVRR